MAKINLTVTNASNAFSEAEIEIIRAATVAAEQYLSKNFSFDYNVDVIVAPPSLLMATIPEDGITGRTYSSRLLVLVIDKQQAEIKEDIVFEIICHEMSHSTRWEKVPEFANTLFKNMILEGLAVVLEEKALADTGRKNKQFFLSTVQNTDQMTIDEIIDSLKPQFDSEQYDYERLFFWGDESLPRWAAYRLGYYFVKKYMQENGISIEEATLLSYKKFSS